MDQTLITAIRTVGQLLLHHPTTKVMARNTNGVEVAPNSSNASCFCYIGAAHAVSHALALHIDGDDLSSECDRVLCGKEGYLDGFDWDCASKQQQYRWSQKLANFNG